MLLINLVLIFLDYQGYIYWEGRNTISQCNDTVTQCYNLTWITTATTPTQYNYVHNLQPLMDLVKKG